MIFASGGGERTLSRLGVEGRGGGEKGGKKAPITLERKKRDRRSLPKKGTRSRAGRKKGDGRGTCGGELGFLYMRSGERKEKGVGG